MKHDGNPLPLPPPMWCPDPAGSNRLRWWDGHEWTELYAPAPVAPNVPPSPAPQTVSQISSDIRVETTSMLEPRLMKPMRQAKTRTTSALAEVVGAATLEGPRYPLDEQIEVVGETYRAKDIRRAFDEAGVSITERGVTLRSVQCILVPEPWNDNDPNAVAVMIGHHHVGYLAADLAVDYTDGLQRLARRGVLATGEARIWAKSDDGVIRARVTILVPEASEFD